MSKDRGFSTVDDVTDTGDTLKTAAGYVQDLQPAEVRTGVLEPKTSSSFQPDYFAGMVREWRWIIYPWAAHEGYSGLYGECALRPAPLDGTDKR
jgi:hypoxanthine phosphoribosyltransferase